MIKIHPLCFLVAVFVLINGQITLFVAYFLALIWHEFGHLLLLKYFKVEIRHCVIYPYGGEIVLQSPYQVRYSVRFFIAAGGPLFSLIGYVAVSLIDSPFSVLFAEANLLILFINLLPIIPLDGGRMVGSILLSLENGYSMYRFFITLSFVHTLLIIVLLLFFLPESIFFLWNACLIFSQIFQLWMNRKYSVILEKTLYKELT